MKLKTILIESRLEKLISRKLGEFLQMVAAGEITPEEGKKEIMALFGVFDKSNYSDVFDNTITEISYKEFKRNNELTDKQKINSAIIEANRQIRTLQRIVTHAQKFKTELNITTDQYWSKTNEAIAKITERLIDVATKFKNLR